MAGVVPRYVAQQFIINVDSAALDKAVTRSGVNFGSRDYFGNPLFQRKAPDYGACERAAIADLGNAQVSANGTDKFNVTFQWGGINVTGTFTIERFEGTSTTATPLTTTWPGVIGGNNVYTDHTAAPGKQYTYRVTLRRSS